MALFFSIVIPTLNEEECISRLISNLQKQKAQNFELIICDSSQDSKTENKIKENRINFPIFFLRQTKQSASFQRNYGATHSSGKYIIFLDADTQIRSTFTLKLEKIISKRKGLIFKPYTIPEEKKYPEINALFTVWNILVELSFRTDNPFGDGSCMIFERNFFFLIGRFDESIVLAEDHEIMRRSAKWGIKPKFIPEVKAITSLRRLNREGRLQLLYKYSLVTFHSLFKKKIYKKNKPFEYIMGGRVGSNYRLSKAKMTILDNFLSQKLIRRVKRILKNIFFD